MITYIMVWVLVVAPSTHQNSPIISAPVADLASCERMQKAMTHRNASSRDTQCVEVKMAVTK